MPKPFFLAIEGPIGVGKTTLARLLQPRLGSHLVLEAFDENPFLSDFYADRARYAFQTQMFFLLSRYRQQQSILSLPRDESVIADYTFGKDSLFARLNLDVEELKIYRRVYDVLEKQVPLPDLVVYLRADTDALIARIAARDRSYERKMERDYIASVEAAYERHFSHYTATPLLTIDTEDLNVVRDARALAFVEAEVRRALGIGGYQQALPEMGRPRVRKTAPPPGRVADEQSRGALETFARANEAMAQLGSMLAADPGGLSGGPTSRLQGALEAAMEHLILLAERVGVELHQSPGSRTAPGQRPAKAVTE